MAAGRIDRRVKPAIEYTVELCAAVIREADGSKARARLDLRPLGIPFRQEPSGASEGNARQTERAPRDQTDVKKAPRVDHAVGDAELLLEFLEPLVEARLQRGAPLVVALPLAQQLLAVRVRRPRRRRRRVDGLRLERALQLGVLRLERAERVGDGDWPSQGGWAFTSFCS